MPWQLLSSSCCTASGAQFDCETGMVRMSASFARGAHQLLLPGRHVDLVVMQRVQRRGGGRRHPGGVGAGLRVADLLRQHVGHPVGRRPHALADLRLARQAAGRPTSTFLSS